MKKFIIVALTFMSVLTVMARPYHGGGHITHGRWDMRYSGNMGWGRPVHHGGFYHHHHHGGLWGRGGRNFLPGFAGAVVGTVVGGVLAPRSTVIVEQPATVVRTVPVESPYSSTYVSPPTIVNQTPVQVVQPTTVVTQPRWISGHYEIRTFGDGPSMTSMNIWIPGHWE